MGFFRDMYELSEPVLSDGDFDYLFFGFMVVLSPIACPLYYVGKIAEEIYE